MKKTLIVLLTTLVASTISVGQTEVGTIPSGEEAYIVPRNFTSNNSAKIAILDSIGNIAIYNSNFTLERTLTNPIYNQEDKRIGVDYVNYDDLILLGNDIGITQTLFNNDEDYEFICINYYEMGMGYNISGCDILSETGNILWSYRFNTDGGDIYIAKFDNKFYLACIEYIPIQEEWGFEYHPGNTKYFLINNNTQNIQEVASLPMNVFPTIANRSQTITVEFENENSAQEIKVINNAGQVVKTIPVAKGQREVKINTSDLKGLNILHAVGKNAIGNSKIIIK